MNYEEFRKNFYVEVPELARITDAELADTHLSLDNMQVRGKNPPKPIKTWIQAGISMKILGNTLVQCWVSSCVTFYYQLSYCDSDFWLNLSF